MQVTSTGGVTSSNTITASGGAATTTNGNGGNAGSITIQNSGAGNVSTMALTASTGNATGTGTAGTVSTGISVTNTAGNIQTGSITTAGGTKGNGGSIVVDASGTVATTTGSTISASGGGAAGSMQGTDAGNVTISGTAVTMTLAAAGNLISASGGNAATLLNARGGHAGAISVTATGGAINFTNGTLNAVGGSAVAGVGAGGDAKNVTLSATGDVTANAINVRTGSSFGTNAASGAAAALSVAGANVALGALTTAGNNQGAGGTIGVTATGTLGTGAINGSGGTALASSAGRNAGSVTLAGTAVSTAAITANGTAGSGTGSGGGTGGIVSATGTTGAVSVGAISTIGGNGGAGNANGGGAGAITLNAGAGSTVTLGGNLTATGGNRVGTGTAGNGAAVQVQDAALLNAATVTVATTGGTGGGTSGDVLFAGTVDSTGGARALAVNTTGTTTFAGAIGGVSALQTLTTNAGGTTAVNGGLVRTVGNQTWADPVTVGAATSFETTGTGNIAFSSTLNSSVLHRAVTINSAAAVNLAAVGTTLPLSSLLARAQGGNLTLGGNVVASGSGDAIVLVAGGNFVNSGNFSLTPGGGGRWLVWSTSPTSDTRGAGLTAGYNFKQYNATYGTTTVAGSGNGFLYTTAPTLTATLSGSAVKTYDATNVAPTGSLVTSPAAGAIDGDSVTLLTTGAIYDTPNAGTGKTVSGSAFNVTATNGARTVYGYQVGAVSGAAVGTINAAPLTLTAQADTKTYNASTASSLTPLVSGLMGSDSVTGLTQAYANPNAGTGKAISVTAYTVNDGAGGGNYTVNTVGSNAGVINKAALTITAQADTKTYDATTGSAGTPLVAGLQGADSVSGLAQAFGDKNAGSGKLLSVSGYAVNDGTGGNNYAITTVNNSSGVINKASLTVGGTAANKVYDGTTSATVASYTDDRIAGDSLSFSGAASFADRNAAAAKTVTVSGVTVSGLDAGNYALTSATFMTSADITPAPLSVTANDATRFAGQPNPPFSASYSGFQGGDNPSALTGTLLFTTPGQPTSAPGTYAITPSGVGASNYSVSYAAGTLHIVPVPVLAVGDPLATAHGPQAALYDIQPTVPAPVALQVALQEKLDDGSVSAFLNTLPATAAGGTSAFAASCAVRVPYAILRCSGR